MDIKNSVVAILNNKGKIVGTGFVAGENLILTCAHVVEQVTAGLNERVTIHFSDNSKTEATVEQSSFSPSHEKDVALLRVDSLPQGIAPLPLGNAAGSAGHDFYAFGYAIVSGEQGIWAKGDILGVVDSGLVQLKSQEPDHGMSGGPVLDEQRRVVIGMVTKGKGFIGEDKSIRNIFTTFATTVEVIRETCSELRVTEICPYRSLDVFNEEDAPFFFGREKVVQKLLDSLKRESRFLAVLGPSGSGKSSVVRAGLIPALRQGKVPGSQKWDIVTIRPGNDPFEQLAGAGFRNFRKGLASVVQFWLETHPEKTRLVLVVDQFEEVLVSTPASVRRLFISELVQLLNAPLEISLVITLRDDFYSRFLQDAAFLAEWLEHGLVNIPPVLERDDLRAMIVEPAKYAGLTFDEGLVDVIIADACETDRSKSVTRSTILPLLEFALTQLWEKREETVLARRSYESIGGVSGGLVQWANKVYYALATNEQKIAKDVFCGLVHPGNDKEQIPDTRRARPVTEVHWQRTNTYAVIEKLVQARLLSTQKDLKTGQESAEIIHETLLREWKLLKNWIVDYKNRDQIARERRRRWIIAGLTFGLLTMVSLSIFAFSQRNSAINSQNTAIAEANSRATAQASAEEQAKTAMEEKQRADFQKKIALSKQALVQAQFIDMGIDTYEHRTQVLLLALESLKQVDSLDYEGETEASQLLRRKLMSFPSPVLNIPLGTRDKLVVYSANRKWVVTSESNDNLNIFSTETGQLVAHFNNLGYISALAISSDGNLLAVASDSEVRIHSISSKKDLFDSPIPITNVRKIVFSISDNLLGIGTENGVTQVWDLNSKLLITTTKLEYKVKSVIENKVTPSITTISFSQDDKFVISCSTSGNSAVANTQTGELFFHLDETNCSDFAAFNKDGNLVITATGDNNLWGWDIKTGQVKVKFVDVSNIKSAKFSADNNLIVTGNASGIVKMWNISSGNVLMRFAADSSINCVDFNNNLDKIVAGSNKGGIYVWNAKTGQEIYQAKFRYGISDVFFAQDNIVVFEDLVSVNGWDTKSLASMFSIQKGFPKSDLSFSKDGRRFALKNNSITVRILDLDSTKDLFFAIHDNEVKKFVISNDGNILVTLSNNTIFVWNINSGKEISQLELDGGETVKTIDISPDGNKILSSLDGHNILIWEYGTNKSDVLFMPAIDNGEDTSLFELKDETFSPNGRWVTAIYSHNKDNIIKNYVYVWDIFSRKLVFNQSSGQINALGFDATGSMIAFEKSPGNINIWRIETGELIFSFDTKASQQITAIAFSLDRGNIAIGTLDGSVSILNIPSSIQKAHFKLGQGINALSFSPDGNWIASGSDDKTARVWDANTGQEIARELHGMPVEIVNFTTDGKWVVSISTDGVKWTWHWKSEDLIQETCTFLPRNFTWAEWKQLFPNEKYRATCDNLPIEPEPTATSTP